MSASLSDDEFQRLQTQLLELRSKNYLLEEKAHKYQNELAQLCHLHDDLKRELSKAQRTISRSKSARDVEQFMQENDILQRKLQSQEDEFRLQNETLMQELSSLVSSNDNLQKELELSKSKSIPLAQLETQGEETTRLKAENAALRKSLTESKLLYEGNMTTDNVLSNSEVDDKENALNSCTSEDILTDNDLKLKLRIELEEKNILKEKIQKLERLHCEEILNLQTENNKLNEKLKKKQEILLQLQEEKEHLYSESKMSFEALQHEKNAEIHKLKEQIQSMQMQLKLAIQPKSCDQSFSQQSDDISSHVSREEGTVEFIAGEKASFECSLNETKLALICSQNELQSLNCRLKEHKLLLRTLQEEKAFLESEKDKMEISLTEKNNLAEKRKKLMDEMNNHMLEISNKHSKEIENLTQQLLAEQHSLQLLYDKEKDARVELQLAKCEVQNLKEEVERLKTQKTCIEDELKESHSGLEAEREEFQKQTQNSEKEHAEALEKLENELLSQLKDVTIQLEVARAEKAEFEEKVLKLQQELKDSVDDHKIHDKKGLCMVKDLKRQLQMERKRAEKLQERLQEVLNEQNRSVDDILQSGNLLDKSKGDASSVSSWSYVSTGTTDKENKEGTLQSDGSSGGHDSPSRTSPTLLENETSNLLTKLAHLQQKNWTLEEKVNHLEMSNEALVDDLLKKTAVIQYYCMEGRADPHSSVVQDKLTIKRIVDFIKDKGDENLREINRRMQRMLEETLTKNMHLQKDIETLSNEVSRLSKMVQVPPDSELQSAVFVDGV